MAQELKPGSRWKSAVSSTEVIVVKPPAEGVTLECGGHAMVSNTEEPPGGLNVDLARTGQTQVGKRFDHPSGLEVLCTKGGDGVLSVDGEVIGTKEAKPLPSSD